MAYNLGMALAQRRLSVEDRRRELLAFGRVHFAEHAFDAMPMEDIAQRAGVSKALLYHYFGGRRGFYLATVAEVTDEVLVVASPPEGDAPLAALVQMVSAFLAYVKENAAIYHALVRGGLGGDTEVDALLDRVRHEMANRVIGVVGLTAEPLTLVAVRGWISFAETAAAEWLDQPSIEEEELVALLGDTLTDLLRRLGVTSS